MFILSMLKIKFPLVDSVTSAVLQLNSLSWNKRVAVILINLNTKPNIFEASLRLDLIKFLKRENVPII